MNSNKNIHTLARAIIIDQGKILLAHHPGWKQGHFYLPGGHIEHGESAQQAVLRELDEEMGIAFKIERFLGCLEYSFIPNLGTKVCHSHEYNFLFLATSSDISADKLPEQKEEHVAFVWLPLQDLATAYLLPAPLVQLIPVWLNEQNKQAFESEMV